MSAGLAVVFDLVREANRRIEARSLSTADAERIVATFRDLDQVLGVLAPSDEALPPDSEPTQAALRDRLVHGLPLASGAAAEQAIRVAYRSLIDCATVTF